MLLGLFFNLKFQGNPLELNQLYFFFFFLMTENKKTEGKLSKNLENPLLEAVKSDDLSTAIASTPQKKKILPNQIPPSLDKFETALSRERESE